MTNQGQHLNGATKPQLEFLRRLARETEGTFIWPSSFAAADREIKELLKTRKAMRADRHREPVYPTRSLAEESGDAAAVREDELSGYGSTAAWGGHHG